MKITGRCEITILKGMKDINVSRNKLIYVVAIGILKNYRHEIRMCNKMVKWLQESQR